MEVKKKVLHFLCDIDILFIEFIRDGGKLMKKSENGSISLYVLIACTFFVTILMAQYNSSLNKEKAIGEEVAQIKENYENTGKYLNYTLYRDVNGDVAPIPKGYEVSTKSNENVIEKGLVISDSRGNEYVWIPCTTEAVGNELVYKRTEWEVEYDNGTDAKKDELTLTDPSVTYSDNDKLNEINENIAKEIVTQVNTEKESVKRYGGYYIGRYEVGNSNNTAVIKANQEPYAEIKWSKAYQLAKGIGGGEGATTYLCSSYAWDTAINFIQNTTGKNYATSVVGFNGNWLSQEVKDNSGKVIKPANTAQRLKTGLTTSLCNIYDMGGNVGEFTTEINPGTSAAVVLRGGPHSYNSPAGYRWDNSSGYANYDCGFRATLFLK